MSGILKHANRLPVFIDVVASTNVLADPKAVLAPEMGPTIMLSFSRSGGTTEAIGAIRRSLKPDGTWFVADIRGYPTFDDNLASQPLSGLLYGFSVTCCMRAALSVPGGEGLGTLGFPEDVARARAGEAGFTRFQKHDFQNPLNDYYEIRP